MKLKNAKQARERKKLKRQQKERLKKLEQKSVEILIGSFQVNTMEPALKKTFSGTAPEIFKQIWEVTGDNKKEA